MPYTPHYRLTCSGVLGEGSPTVEAFSFSIALAKANGPNGGNPGSGGVTDINDGQFQDMATDCEAYFGAPATKISSAAVLTQVKVAFIGADGRYEGPPLLKQTNVIGGVFAGGPIHPPQCALAVSLVTARYGATGKGRFYLPMPGVFLTRDTLQLQQADHASILQSSASFLNALGNEPGIDVLGLTPVVASTKGYNSIVTGVRVGRVLDTIRSRRASLPENYGATVDVSYNS